MRYDLYRLWSRATGVDYAHVRGGSITTVKAVQTIANDNAILDRVLKELRNKAARPMITARLPALLCQPKFY